MSNGDFPTTRNLIDADIGPLRKFTGILDSMPREPVTYGQGESARRSERVTLCFRDIEVIETIEPYNLPTFTFSMSLSNRKKSRWGVFGVSLNAVLDQQYTPEQLDPVNPNYVKPSARMDIKDCINKRLGLVVADGEEGRPQPPILYDGRADEDKPTPAWTVYMVEGVGVIGMQGVTPIEKAMQILDGKTQAEFNSAALADPVIQGDAQLLQAITMPVSAANSFTTVMLTTGQFTKDDQDIFHRV